MFDFISNEFHHRHVFYLDTAGRIHSLPEVHFARLQAGEPDAALPQLAGQRVRFATFRVVRLSSPMQVVDESFSVLPLDAEGNLDAQLDYDALQADVDRLEAHDYAPPAPSPASTLPVPSAPSATSTSSTISAPSTTSASSIASTPSDLSVPSASFDPSTLCAPSAASATPSAPSIASTPNSTEPQTAWAPDSFTHRRLIAALLDAHHHPWPTWWPQHTDHAA